MILQMSTTHQGRIAELHFDSIQKLRLCVLPQPRYTVERKAGLGTRLVTLMSLGT